MTNAKGETTETYLYDDKNTSRFVQEDDYKGRFTRPASMNRYIYTEGNPVMGIDPSGYGTLDDYAYQKTMKSNDAYRKTTVNSYNFYMDYYTKKANTKESLTYTEGYDISKIYSNSPVSKPYTISPSQFSGNVYNCLKDIESGKELVVDSLTSAELDELYDATVDIYEHYESIKDLLDENNGEAQAYSDLYSTYYKASFTVEDRVNYVERNYPNGLYSTFDESALEAYKDTYPITDATKFETGGTLYSVNTSAGKLYSYTDSVIDTNNDPHSVQPMKTLKDVPKDGIVEGYYHNHVNSSNLSGGDITFANNQNIILTGGMPDGSLKMVDPLGTITLVGNVNLSALPALSQSEKDKLVKNLEEDWNNHIAYEKSVNSDSDPTNDTFECYNKYPAWPN